MIEGFVLDESLGRLAKWLRLLGWPARVVGKFPPRPPAGWRALTRRRALIDRPGFVFVAHNAWQDQLRQVVGSLGLAPDPARFFTICLECNLPVEPAGRDQVRGLVPEHTLYTAERFTMCPGCGRVYWPGSHGRRAEGMLRELLGQWGE